MKRVAVKRAEKKPSYYQFIKSKLTKIRLLRATRGACNSNLQGPVVRRPVSANPGLTFNLGFFFFCSKAFSRINLFILFRASNHQTVGKKNKTEFAFLSFQI